MVGLPVRDGSPGKAATPASLAAMATTRRFVVPFKAGLAFECALTVEDIDAEHAEATADAVMGGLRLVSDDGHGNFIPLPGDLSVTEYEIGEPQEIEAEGVAASGDRSLARGSEMEEES